jgi:hypothetical protein
VDALDPQFLLYVVILAIVAISTIVKKVFERAATKDGEKKVDLREAVREQLRRYMGEGQAPPGPFPGRPVAPPPESARPPPPARPVAAAPSVAAAKGQPPPLPQGQISTALAEEDRPPISLPPVNVTSTVGLLFSRGELRRAILLAEVLGPPVSERSKDRLV